jgi:hypothetical protein
VKNAELSSGMEELELFVQIQSINRDKDKFIKNWRYKNGSNSWY